MTPGCSLSPIIVCVFPLLVCPYAKTVPDRTRTAASRNVLCQRCRPTGRVATDRESPPSSMRRPLWPSGHTRPGSWTCRRKGCLRAAAPCCSEGRGRSGARSVPTGAPNWRLSPRLSVELIMSFLIFQACCALLFFSRAFRGLGRGQGLAACDRARGRWGGGFRHTSRGRPHGSSGRRWPAPAPIPPPPSPREPTGAP